MWLELLLSGLVVVGCLMLALPLALYMSVKAVATAVYTAKLEFLLEMARRLDGMKKTEANDEPEEK